MSKRLIPDSHVAERYGVRVCTLMRWERDPHLDFPKAVKIRGRNYRDEAQLDTFDEAQQAKPTTHGCAKLKSQRAA